MGIPWLDLLPFGTAKGQGATISNSTDGIVLTSNQKFLGGDPILRSRAYMLESGVLTDRKDSAKPLMEFECDATMLFLTTKSQLLLETATKKIKDLVTGHGGLD